MSYTPNNDSIYTAAYAGVLSGMGLFGVDTNGPANSELGGLAAVAGAFAEKVDTLYTDTPTDLQIALVTSLCQYVWNGKPISNAITTAPSSYLQRAEQVISLLSASTAFFGDRGVTPPSPASSPITASANLDGNIDPTFTLYTIPSTVDGIYWADVDVMVDEIVGGVLTHAKGGAMRAIASWQVVAGVATTLVMHHAAGDGAVGGGVFYLMTAPMTDGDLDFVVVDNDMTVRVTPSVFAVARYQMSLNIRGPVSNP